MKMAMDKIKEIQYILGGMVIFLEAEENAELLTFYKDKNGFMQFGKGLGITDEELCLMQMLRIL